MGLGGLEGLRADINIPLEEIHKPPAGSLQQVGHMRRKGAWRRLDRDGGLRDSEDSRQFPEGHPASRSPTLSLCSHVLPATA